MQCCKSQIVELEGRNMRYDIETYLENQKERIFKTWSSFNSEKKDSKMCISGLKITPLHMKRVVAYIDILVNSIGHTFLKRQLLF